MSGITVTGLTKCYGNRRVVEDVSFQAQQASVFALLGPNGAGKSTTISCLTTLLPFDAGALRVAGYDVGQDPEAVRRVIGVVFQESLLDPALTVRENLSVRARPYTTSRADTAVLVERQCAAVGLSDELDQRYSRLSGGQRRRADIARALLSSPAVLFLDEPTANLDPSGRLAVWSAIRELCDATGLTVFLTTHYMPETERADDVCVIDRGHVIAQGSPALLRAEYSSSTLTLRGDDRSAITSVVARHGLTPKWSAETATVTIDRPQAALRVLADLGGLISDFEFQHGSMDDVFLNLTTREGVD